jgi:hypothetical protein
VLLPLLCALLTVTGTVLWPKRYTTRLSFTPAGTTLPEGSLASLAGQFGVSLGLDPGASPDFYAALVKTREILQPLVERSYRVVQRGDTVTASFITLYGISERDSGRTVAAAIEEILDEVMTVSTNRRTSVVQVDVQTKWPELSLQIAQALVLAIDDFNFRSRQRQGGAERSFLEQRLDTARTELREAQNSLEQFYATNRSYENDPALRFVHERLQRDVSLRSDVFGMLTQSYEQARVAAVRNTPSVAPVEDPKVALRPDRRHLVTKSIGGAFVGTILAILWVVWSEVAARTRVDTPARYAELSRRWKEALNEARLLFLRRAKPQR